MPDPLDDLHELGEEAARTGAALEEARPRDAVTVEHESGALIVTMDADGSVVEVRLTTTWRSGLADDELAGAVLLTVAKAAAERGAGWMTRFAEALERPRPTPLPAPGTPVRAVPAEARDMFTATLRQAGGIRQVTSDLVAQLTAAARQRHPGTGTLRQARAEMNLHGELFCPDIDPLWQRQAEPAVLGREITEAIRAAGRAVAEAPSMDDVLAQSTLGRLQSLLTSGPRPTTR